MVGTGDQLVGPGQNLAFEAEMVVVAGQSVYRLFDLLYRS